MSLERSNALSSARKLVRWLDSAPDPLRQARSAVGLLLKESGWSKDEERLLLDLAAWLAQRPPPGALKSRCQAALRRLTG